MIRLRVDPATLVQRWPTPNSREWTLAFVRACEDDENVAAVVLVGSAARRDVPSDDLDLIVICKDRRKLNAEPPIEVDLRVYESSVAESLVAEGSDLLAWAVNFGVSLYDRTGLWRELVTSWSGRVPLPDPVEARARASRSLLQAEAMEAAGDSDAAAEIRVSYLTHLARAVLSEAGVVAASRPELPDQLAAAGDRKLAAALRRALANRTRKYSSLNTMP